MNQIHCHLVINIKFGVQLKPVPAYFIGELSLPNSGSLTLLSLYQRGNGNVCTHTHTKQQQQQNAVE